MHFLKQYFHFITIPPLLPLLHFFIIGILSKAFNISITIVIFPIFVFIFVHFFYRQKPLQSLSKMIIFFLVALSGSFLYEKEITDYNNFYQFANNNPINIIGTIEDINQTTINKKKVSIITLNVLSVQKEDIIQNINKYVCLYTKSTTHIQVGDTISLARIVCKKPNSEQLVHYQIRENIIATIFNDRPLFTVINRPHWSFKKFVFNQKQKILRNCEEKLSSQAFSFFSSLFLGNRLYVKTDIETTNEQFKQWGIFHFLARSGLHLALFITTWQYMLKFIPISFNMKNILMIILSILYALLSWSSLPFARSLFLFFLNKACILYKQSYSLLHYLTLICFCFLLYCPLYLFFLDFQLTFGITFALAWFNQLHAQCLYSQSSPKQLNY